MSGGSVDGADGVGHRCRRRQRGSELNRHRIGLYGAVKRNDQSCLAEEITPQRFRRHERLVAFSIAPTRASSPSAVASISARSTP